MSDDDWHRTRANLNPEDANSPLYHVQGLRPSNTLDQWPPSPATNAHPLFVLAGVIGICLLIIYMTGGRGLVLGLALGAVVLSLLGLWAWRRFRRNP
jgi:hypothetical protein